MQPEPRNPSDQLRTVKESIARKNAEWERARQTLRLQDSTTPLHDGDTLASLGLASDAAPTLLLQVAEPEPPPSVLEAVMAPALAAAEAAAAARIQAAARGIFARRELAWRRKARRLLLLCAHAEVRARG